MKKLKIMEWNINQQGRQYENGKSNDGEIATWIIDEISDDIDIVVFTEFNCHAQNITEIYNLLLQKGFFYYVTNYFCAYSNDILIAVRKEITVKSTSYYKAYSDTPNTNCSIDWSGIPENLRVDIIVNEIDISIWGIRIKDLNGDYQKRELEMRTFLNWLKKVDGHNIVVGDFNNLREDTTIVIWNLGVIDNLLKSSYTRKTPKNTHSWGVAKNNNGKYDGYIKNDHLIHSNGIEANVEDYKWGFLENKKYTLKPLNFGKQEIAIPIGKPDHGILIGTFMVKTNE